MSDKYNGWTNRETWLVNLWYEPTTKNDLDFIREDLENKVEEIGNGIIQDMINLSAINWCELEEHIED